jgi:hypothetical protein
MFVKNKQHGEGILTTADKPEQKGIWKNGELQVPLRNDGDVAFN